MTKNERKKEKRKERKTFLQKSRNNIVGNFFPTFSFKKNGKSLRAFKASRKLDLTFIINIVRTFLSIILLILFASIFSNQWLNYIKPNIHMKPRPKSKFDHFLTTDH